MTDTRLIKGFQSRSYSVPEIRAEATSDGDRIVRSIGVPYGVEIELFPGYYETIAPGAVQPRDHRMLYWAHETPIGLVIEETDTPEAWSYAARFSSTPTADEAYTLTMDTVVRSSSIGFFPIEWEMVEDEDGVHITHTKIDVREVSLVPIPAYDGATVTDIRHAGTPQSPAPAGPPNQEVHPMSDSPVTLDSIQADNAALARSVEDINRTLELIRAGGHHGPETPHPLAQFRSVGDYLKKAAAGDPGAARAAAELHTRAFEGGLVEDGGTGAAPGWVADLIKLEEVLMPVANSFLYTKDLPREGMSLEYGVLESEAMNVATQATQGDNLVGPGKITIGVEQASVLTGGGWSALSRQAVERSRVNLLDLHMTALNRRLLRWIEAQARATFTTTFDANLAAASDIQTLAKAYGEADAIHWLALILDLAENFDDKGYPLAGIKVSREVFLALAAVPSTQRLLVVKQAPTDQPGTGGTLDVSVPEADLYGMSVELIPNWAGAKMAAYSREAIRTQVDPATGFLLQDDNIVNLTKVFSTYTYLSSYTQIPDAIVPVDLDGI